MIEYTKADYGLRAKSQTSSRLYDPLQACRISEFLAAASARNRRFRDVCARTRYQAAGRKRVLRARSRNILTVNV